MNEEELAAAAAAAAAADTTEEDEAVALWNEFEEDESGTIDLTANGASAGEPGDAGETIAAADDAAIGADVSTDAPQPDANTSTVWATVPEAARTEFEKLREENARLLQKERSSTGRATSFQRRYEELAKAAQPRTPAGGDRPSSEAAIEALREDYPEIAEPLSQALNAIRGDVETLTAAEESRVTAAQAELDSYLDEETTALKSQHPDYEDVLKANAPKFVAWIDDQPRAIRDAFAKNANGITDAAGAATVVGMFKQHLGMPATVPAAQTAETPASDPLASRRSRQLAGTSALTKTHRRPTVSGIPEEGDPQAIWDALEAQEAKEAGRR